MSVSPVASDAKVTEAVTVIGATAIGRTEQTLLQQILVAIGVTGGGAPTSNWILATGLWNDSGVWDDTANWID